MKRILISINLIVIVVVALYCYFAVEKRNNVIEEIYINYYKEFIYAEDLTKDSEGFSRDDSNALVNHIRRAEVYAEMIEFYEQKSEFRDIAYLIRVELEQINNEEYLKNSLNYKVYHKLIEKINMVREKMETDIIVSSGSKLKARRKFNQDTWVRLFSEIRQDIDTTQKKLE